MVFKIPYMKHRKNRQTSLFIIPMNFVEFNAKSNGRLEAR